MYCDAHTHCIINDPNNTKICLCYDFEKTKNFSKKQISQINQNCNIDLYLQNIELQKNQNIIYSLGIHPWELNKENLNYLIQFFKNKKKYYNNTELLSNNNKKIIIGEIGLDLYTEELKNNINEQIEFFSVQLNLAIELNSPVIIHCRKAIHQMFTYVEKLKLLPAVIFHDFGGSIQEAEYFLRKGVTAYFSFGKSILNNKKNSIFCVKKLPITTLLAETDNTYESIEVAKKIIDIKKVYNKIDDLRQENCYHQLEKNFNKAFLIH